jgi:hypothetical protein
MYIAALVDPQRAIYRPIIYASLQHEFSLPCYVLYLFRKLSITVGKQVNLVGAGTRVGCKSNTYFMQNYEESTA